MMLNSGALSGGDAIHHPGCLQIALSGALTSETARDFSVDFQWVEGDFGADVILDLGEINYLDESSLDILCEVAERLNPMGARIMAYNVPSDLPVDLINANLPFEVIAHIH